MPEYKSTFNKWASSYDEDVIKSARAGDWMFGDYDRVLDKIVEYCRLEENSCSSVLDIGIGTGNLAARFLRRGMQVTGIDPSVEMRKICRRKYPRIKVVAGDFLKIPRSLPAADVIVSAYAFHHLMAEEKVKAIGMMKEYLELKGCIVIADLMFQNTVEENRVSQELKNTGRADVLDEFEDEFPALYDDLVSAFKKEGFSVSGEQLTPSVWIIRACL